MNCNDGKHVREKVKPCLFARASLLKSATNL